VSGAASGTARARIARYGARGLTNSQSSPTHRDHHHAGDSVPPPPGHQSLSFTDSDDDAAAAAAAAADDNDNDDDDDAVEETNDQRGQLSRLLVCFDETDLKDTRV